MPRSSTVQRFTIPLVILGALRAAGGNLKWKVTDLSDSGAFMGKWRRDTQGNLDAKFTASDFYGDLASDGLNVTSAPFITTWISYFVGQQDGKTKIRLTSKVPVGEDREVSVEL